MLKKFTRRLALSLFSLTLVCFVLLSALLTTLRPEHIKTWLTKSGIYQIIPDVVVNQLAKNQSADTGEISFKDVAVQRAVGRALNSGFVEKASGSVIDGTFRWLDGNVAKPDFVVNVASAKAQFADELATIAQRRYEQLPVCDPRQQPTNLGPLTIDCQIRGYDLNQTTTDFKARVLANKDFLPSSTLTADSNLTTDATTGKVEPIVQYSRVIPERYQQLQIARWVALGLSIGLGLAIIYLSDTKLAGLKRIGKSLLVVSVTSALGLWILFVAANSLKGRIPVSLSEEGLRDALLQLADFARRDVTIAAGKILGIYALLGIGLVGGVYLKTRDRTPRPTAKVEPKQPTTSITK